MSDGEQVKELYHTRTVSWRLISVRLGAAQVLAAYHG